MSSKGPIREWVGGRLTLPVPIESMGERRAEISLWVELPELHIVGQILEDPEDPEATFGQSLMRAMASPLVGGPRRPQRVRVADPALAEQLQSFSFLRVDVAPTPELDRVMRSLHAFLGQGSYFSDPHLTPKDIEMFFDAARALWAARPWTIADDEELVHIDVPTMGIHDGCISIIGAREEDVHGFVLLPSYEDYRLMTESTEDEPASYRALYVSFDPPDEVPEAMREEVAEHGWPVSDEDAYPMLLRIVEGKAVPAMEPELKLATAISRALGTFAVRYRQAFESYGEVEARASFDDDELALTLSVPHPDAEQDDEWRPTRAPTLSVENPYGLPLEPAKLRSIERTLRPFTLHRALGLFCAVASVPQMPPTATWLGEILREVQFTDEAELRSVVDQLMVVYNHVVTTIEHEDIDGLVPEAADVDGCREWARGYATLLSGLDLSKVERSALDSIFAIQVLAETPHFTKLLDEFRGKQNREAVLQDYRESLADDADFLLETWAEARATPQTTVRREVLKVGRNDPCPCGSGKKHKKCCAKA